ncbi:MAG: hypothetical protein PHW64_03365 [Sulfuricurvum sp.]|nr:hypothetical protein [Sulfuricurvum sp.]
MNYRDYTQEVIDVLCDLEGYTHDAAVEMIQDKEEQIRYAHQYRLNPTIIAGSILGINDCCVAPASLKS